MSPSRTSLVHLLRIPAISTSILALLPLASAYIPAQPVNDTSTLNLTDSSTISISWQQPAGVFSGSVSYQLEADVPTGGTTSGALVHFAESSMGVNLTTETPWIAYISCDVNETSASQEWDIFTLARDRGAVSALLYTSTSQSCLLNQDYIQNFEKPLDVFATKTVQVARVIDNQFIHTNDTFFTYNGTLLNISGTAVNASLAGSPLGTRTYLIGTLAARNSTGQATNTAPIPNATSSPTSNSSSGPPASMIALYVIVGIIATIFSLMVLIGARRARRHPERYGRRIGDGDQPPQSRAGGIAQAILDTFPVIKFNRQTQTHAGTPKRLSSDRDVHSMTMLDSRARSPSSSNYDDMALPFRDTAQRPHEQSEDYGDKGKYQGDVFDVASGSGSGSSHRRSRSLLSPGGSRRTSGNELQHQALMDGVAEEEGRSVQDQCPICLLDFEEGDDLRVLPCEREHVYHQGCIDPWLLQVSGSCPLCRKDFNNPNPPESSSAAPSPTTAANVPAPSGDIDLAATQPPTQSGFAKYLAWMRRERRRGARRRERAGTVGTLESGIGQGRRREADQTGPGGY